MGTWPLVPKPLVLFTSATALPVKYISVTLSGKPRAKSAMGCWSQWVKSLLVAWPQDILPHSMPPGLYWKNKW